jgi:ABC-type multidrug transport system fused ATPase/permease subunit
VLFSDSIAKNIAYGVKEGKVTQQQIEAAARMANAHDFIVSFPNGRSTIGINKTSCLSPMLTLISFVNYSYRIPDRGRRQRFSLEWR